MVHTIARLYVWSDDSRGARETQTLYLASPAQSTATSTKVLPWTWLVRQLEQEDRWSLGSAIPVSLGKVQYRQGPCIVASVDILRNLDRLWFTSDEADRLVQCRIRGRYRADHWKRFSGTVSASSSRIWRSFCKDWLVSGSQPMHFIRQICWNRPGMITLRVLSTSRHRVHMLWTSNPSLHVDI